MNKNHNLFKFISAVLKCGSIGFGGGTSLIPVIEKELCQETEIDTAENIERDVVVASLTPGALPVEIASGIGLRCFGIRGMLAGAAGMALPGVLMTMICLLLYEWAQSILLPYLQVLTITISAFINAILLEYVGRIIFKYRYKSLFVTAVVFLLCCGKNVYQLLGLSGTPFLALQTLQILVIAFFFLLTTRGSYDAGRLLIAAGLSGLYLLTAGKNPIWGNEAVFWGSRLLMAACAIRGLTGDILKNRRQDFVSAPGLKKHGKAVLVWFAVVAGCVVVTLLICPRLLGWDINSILSVVMSFGGGDSYLSVAKGMYVDEGWIGEAQYFGTLVNVVNILPGSILCKMMTGIGYYTATNLGLPYWGRGVVAGCGFLISMAVSCGTFHLFYLIYDDLKDLKTIRMISRWISPIIAGLLLNVMLSLLLNGMQLSQGTSHSKMQIMGVSVLLTAGNYFLLCRFKNKTFLCILFNLLLAGVYYYVVL